MSGLVVRRVPSPRVRYRNARGSLGSNSPASLPRSREEADRPLTDGYPPPAQVLSVLYNAIFLDLIDEDILRLERMNRLIDEMPVPEREGMRLVEILVLRPSRDLGKLAGEFEPKLPRAFRYLTRGLGTRRTSSPDILSLIMFQTDYLRRLVELGEGDVEANKDRIDAFIGHQPAAL